MNSNIIKSILFGVAVGDALGVPVEFKKRKDIRSNPVVDMISIGTYNLPKGTWSDDCLIRYYLDIFDSKNFSNEFFVGILDWNNL